MFVEVYSMTFAQRRNRLTTHFSERIPVVKRGISILSSFVSVYSMTFAQRRDRLTTHFSERIPVVKRRMTVFYSVQGEKESEGRVGFETAAPSCKVMS